MPCVENILDCSNGVPMQSHPIETFGHPEIEEVIWFRI
ncbi:MAG TPA: hypothetical protein DCY35_00395 [Prolixibacteraceae bacterium]|nr:hypothetical protein [Prolixibacteraceae bacterium]